MRQGHAGETVQDMRATVDRLSVEAFARHELTLKSALPGIPADGLTVRGDKTDIGLWRCARPDVWTYGFYLLVTPGTWVIWGDVGDAMFHCGATLEQAAQDPRYLLSKMSEPPKQFYPGEAVALAQEHLQYVKERSGNVAHAKKFLTECARADKLGDFSDHDFYHLAQAWAPDLQISGTVHYTAHCYWMVAAMQTFVRLRKAGQ